MHGAQRTQKENGYHEWTLTNGNTDEDTENIVRPTRITESNANEASQGTERILERGQKGHKST